MARRKRRHFTDEFKADAVRLCKQGDRSIAHVAKDLDLTETSLRESASARSTHANPGATATLSTAEREELSELRKRVKRLEMEREILKKSGGLLREGDNVNKFTFVLAEEAKFPVRAMCEVLGVSASGFYAWCKRPKSARALEDDELVDDIKAAHKAGRGTYGTRRIHNAVKKNGWRVSAKRVDRLRKEQGLVVKTRRRFKVTTDSRHADPVAPNVLDRKFDVAEPNAAWVTDVTYVWTLQGWLYLAAIIDLCSRRVVGWATSENNDRALALAALSRAVAARRPRPGWLHHSDRGSVYASGDYKNSLDALGSTRSMSRKGNCWDNAVAESFFATIKGECLDHERLYTRAQELTNNHRRRPEECDASAGAAINDGGCPIGA